jgi:serine/threonine protein kinase
MAGPSGGVQGPRDAEQDLQSPAPSADQVTPDYGDRYSGDQPSQPAEVTSAWPLPSAEPIPPVEGESYGLPVEGESYTPAVPVTPPAGQWQLSRRDWTAPGYTELKVLGSGGFGEVVLARHDISGIQVAIKYLRRSLLDEPGFADMFRAEARVLASLQDRNVVRLYEYIEGPAGAAIVMELVDGVSLRGILSRQGRTSAEAALVVLQGSLMGLAAAHQRGVVHRDYKPENVLVGGDGVSKLTDFGIAARTGDRPFPAGTLAYAPPEQLAGGPATPATDVYAATATFYECLIGRPPFTGDTAEALLWQHRSQPVPLELVPVPLRPMVAAGMAKDPSARPPDAATFVAGLNAAAAGAYGPDWENRGRSHLAEAALLLAALWPSGGAPAVGGHLVEHLGLSHGGQPSHGVQPPHPYQGGVQPPSPGSPEYEHLRHLEHVRHLDHLRHLRRLRMGLGGAGAVAAAAIVAVVVIAPWKSPPPVLKPTGLVVDASTTSSLALRWSSPATGPAPSEYEILADNQVLGTVPGNVTYYRVAGLAPDTDYQFQVIAIRGGKHSPRSAVLDANTLTPPVSAAVLDQKWTVDWRIASIVPADSNITPGSTWTDSWTFVPDCTSGPCSVTLHGNIDQNPFTVSLSRSGAVYSGTAGLDDYTYCVQTSNKVDDTMHVQLQVQGAGVQGHAWAARSWTGTVVLDIPSTSVSDGNCYADTETLSVSGGPSTG